MNPCYVFNLTLGYNGILLKPTLTGSSWIILIIALAWIHQLPCTSKDKTKSLLFIVRLSWLGYIYFVLLFFTAKKAVSNQKDSFAVNQRKY